MTTDLQAKVAAAPYWYHRIELPGGVVTPGWAPISPASYGVPPRLDGQRVLDVGAWDGFWSFEALKRGAREVLAIDDFSDALGSTVNAPRQAWENFDLCKQALGYTDTQCQRREMSVYDVSPETVGMFDTVFFFGALYHLRHPLLALDKLASVCTSWIFVESAVLDDYSPYRGGLGHGYPDKDQVVMEFYPEDQYGANATNWWTPTCRCLGHMVRAAGFENLRVWKLTATPQDKSQCRGFVLGQKPGAKPIPR